jgi:hypothetical protein
MEDFNTEITNEQRIINENSANALLTSAKGDCMWPKQNITDEITFILQVLCHENITLLTSIAIGYKTRKQSFTLKTQLQ